MVNSVCDNTTLASLYSNCTKENKEDLVIAFRVFSYCVLIFIMVAMGCTMMFTEVIPHLKRPWGILIGFLSQYGIMPLVGFTLAHAMQLKPQYAIGMLIITCCPGGTTSNIFTYWTDGEVPLSVLMTVTSTLLALGMMPLTLYIYTRSWTSEQAAVPYINILQSLGSILLPVLVGMLIKWKFPRAAQIIIKICSILSVLGMIVHLILGVLINPYMFNAPWSLYFGAFLIPFIGFGLGYTLATIVRFSPRRRRTIAFETGLQNIALSVTIISLSFSTEENLGDYLVFSLLYAPAMLFDATMFLIARKMYLLYKSKMEEKPPNEEKDGVSNKNDEDNTYI